MSTTRTSSTERPPASTARVVVVAVIGVLALLGATLSQPGTTGALYRADTAATMSGFQVQPLCDFDDYESVQDLIDDLGPDLRWGFAPGTTPWSDDAGSPTSVAPDGTLLCDDGVLPLEEGRSVWTPVSVPGPATAVLVLGTPTAAGTALTVAEAAGAGLAVRVTSTGATLYGWDAESPPVQVAAAAFGSGAAHVVAVVLDGATVTLWVDDGSDGGTLPAVVGAPTLGLGAVPGTEPEGETPVTATFVATELALVPAAVQPAALSTLHASATAP